MRIQAVYRGEGTRNRVVQPALAAFRDVCARISAECSGLTTDSLCGPVHLPSWLSTGHSATTPAAGTPGAGSVDDGRADFTTGSSDNDVAASAAAASTTLPRATALRDKEAATGSDESEEQKRPPPRPVTPTLSSVLVESKGVLAPPGAAVAIEGRDPTKAPVVEDEAGEEEEDTAKKEGQETANLDTARTENMVEVRCRIDAPRSGGNAQQLVEDSVKQDAMGGSDQASPSADNEGSRASDRHQRRQHSTELSDGEENARARHSLPLCSEEETTRPASCDKLAVESNVADTCSSSSTASRTINDADEDCFTYSDGEDGGFAETPGRNNTDSYDSVLVSPHPNDCSASSSAGPPRPTTSLVVDASVSSAGDRGEGIGICSCNNRDPDNCNDSASDHPKQLLYSLVGEGTTSKGNSCKQSGGGAEGSGGGEAGGVFDDKRESSKPPAVVEDCAKRGGMIVDLRNEGDMTRKVARAASRQDTAKPAALEEREARTVREGGERSLAGGIRGRSSADFLAHAYATASSPTRDTPGLLGERQIGVENLGGSLTGSVSSSFDTSPLKGESISTSALAAARMSSDARYSDGVVCADGVDLLAAAKAVVGGERSFAGGATATGKDLSAPFSAWLDEDRRPEQTNWGVGFPVDIDRRASGSSSAHNYSRRLEPTLKFAAHDVDEAGCDGERAASISDWSSEELEEELRRVREAIESRVRYLLSIVRESGSAAI
eukprot:g12776.t1